MADVDTLLDFDSPSLTSAHQTAGNDASAVSLMDPFSADYQVDSLARVNVPVSAPLQ